MTSDKLISRKLKERQESFEQSLKRLEQIVDDLEQGNVPLDNAILLYEEGVQISKVCLQKLQDAELKIKRLTKSINGEFKLSNESAEE